MQIELQNIGIVEESSLALEGLTVITGRNNSGKTTVGRALYSLLDAVCDLEKKAENDKKVYIREVLIEVADELRILRVFAPVIWGDGNLGMEYPRIKRLTMLGWRRVLISQDLERFAHEAADELTNFSTEEFERNLAKNHIPIEKIVPEGKTVSELLDKQRRAALERLGELFEILGKDTELIDYARESINQTLGVEFSKQIQPVRRKNIKSQLLLRDSDSVFFNLSIINNRVKNDGAPVFIRSPFSKVFFIDDPFIVDNAFPSEGRMDDEEDGIETVLNPHRIKGHNSKLIEALRGAAETSIFEQIVLNDRYKAVKEKIDKILPGTFELSKDGDFYIQNGAKLKISNLATGSKMFSIIKMLFEKGNINPNTMLILDEPESHLHPAWQNAFAEIIVLMVKIIGVRVLLTTHSPNFALALDAYMRKYGIQEKTNFYQTQGTDNGGVCYQCVNDDLGKIYSDFLEQFAYVKAVRDLCLNGECNDKL